MAKELFRRGKSKVWHYRFTPPGGGQQVRGSTHTDDKTLAEECLQAQKNDAWRVFKLGEREEKLWLEAAARWIEEKMDTKRDIENDASKLKILNTVMKDMTLSQIDGEWVQKNVVEGLLKKRKVGPTTINRYLELIRSIMRRAWMKWLWIDVAPPLIIHGKDVERARKAWLTPDQFKRLIAALPDHLGDVVRFAAATGMREANILRLEWWQIDLENNQLLIPAEWFKGKRDHTVPLNQTAKTALINQIGKHGERVFTYKGEPFSNINLRWWHKRLDEIGLNAELRESGLLRDTITVRGREIPERFVFHGLRHTFATWLADMGTPKVFIYEAGGWKYGDESGGKALAQTCGDDYQHLAGVNHLLPFVRRIDQLLKGELTISSTKLARDKRVNLAQRRKSLILGCGGRI